MTDDKLPTTEEMLRKKPRAAKLPPTGLIIAGGGGAGGTGNGALNFPSPNQSYATAMANELHNRKQAFETAIDSLQREKEGQTAVHLAAIQKLDEAHHEAMAVLDGQIADLQEALNMADRGLTPAVRD